MHAHLRSSLRKAEEGVDAEDPNKLKPWDDISMTVRTTSATAFAAQYGQDLGAVSSAMRE
jgi:hypothetical protein